ncbi:MAG: undecaprenyldiphospho-muramoylpentapeptide beta-N-acetylglucosaminyltransferase [Gammaproteobacteria bacterium]|uniref:undecaprenyldiphospho-muramoylpentapeptide beta-N-acetylglucosaminyltransferase n=1 Tax=Methylotuvimicrobium sp. TaxID=2822413 RepID=UPI001E015EDA|nr:undecaprenyldiphospho-muramoylpentapeptide beta-N-acetylglucosaminyltransferase [Gammaproteobacteria bacterium]
MGARILIMAGGTGGHVFPALAVANYLVEQGWQMSWLGTKNGLESRVVPAHKIDIDWLSVAGVRGKGLFSKIRALLLLIKACGQAWWILRRRKPDVVLGMGGFVAGPGGLMAKLMGIPLVIHEQNRVPGTTNRLLARWANRVLEAFPGSFDKKINALWSGNPLRKELIGIPEKKARQPGEALRLLVIGGSQGAQVLNQVVPDAVAAVSGLNVRHQTGEIMRTQVEQRYQELGVDAEVSAFIEDMAEAYRWADIAVCRAGAMTISELAAAGIPAVLIPLPHAIDDHQNANARYLADVGAAMILPQIDLSPETLAERIKDVIERLAEMSKKTRACAKLDATAAVALCCQAESGR